MKNVRILLSCIFCLLFVSPAYADVVASSSDAAEEVYDEVLSDESEGPMYGTPAAVYSLDSSVQSRAVSETDLVNCCRFDVSINGDPYILLLPVDFEGSIMVDSDGYLWNMSGSTISGRLFNDSFDPTAETGLILYLGPCLGNNFSANSSYGSPNYIREYYWSSGRLTYDTTYVVVETVDTYWLFNTQDILKYISIFLVGCCLICLWKRS